VLRRYAGDTRLWGVLKADGYGHGAPAVARTLERAGIDGICVALLEEAVELRNAGIHAPILVMGGNYGHGWGELLAHDLTPVVYDPGQLEALAREVRLYGHAPVGVHLKVDTGMSRLGVRHDAIGTMLERIRSLPEVRLTGMMTHFADADGDNLDVTDHQCTLFDRAVHETRTAGFHPDVIHAANSAALIRVPHARYDLARPGIALSTWKAQRTSQLATVPMGYADGLPRSLSNKGRVLVRGASAPIVGNVSMDMIMIDVTNLPGVSLRDEVVVLGPQQGPLGSDVIGADEIARHADTISWEILTGISRRVPRFFREP
jgi:alanine racemase